MKKSKKSSLFVRNSNVVFRDVDGTVHILDTNDNTLRTLNVTASYLWRVLKKPTTKNELIQKVCEEYKMNVNEVKNDLEEFLQAYISRRYILSE